MHRLPLRHHRVRLTRAPPLSSATLVLMVSRLKAILFTLVRAFEFEFAVPVEDIVCKTPFGRPSLLSEPAQGYQLPLILKPYKAA